MPATQYFTTGAVNQTPFPVTTLTAEDGINQVYSTDLDGDGSSDLVVFGATWPPNGAGAQQPGFVMFGDGKGGYLAPDYQRFPALSAVHRREVAFADFNGDKYPDIFVADQGYDAAPFPGAQNHLYLSNGNGTWRDATANLPAVADFTHSVSTGDLNNDGHIDILVGNSALPSFTYVLLNNGQGNFQPSTQLLPTDAGELLDPTKRNSLASTIADLDGDGWSDIVLGTGVPNPLKVPMQVLWSNAGNFDAPAITNTPLPKLFGQKPDLLLTYDVHSIDVNFDGLGDLVVAWIQSVDAGGYELQVLINDGKRGFTDQTAKYIPDSSAISNTNFDWVQFLVPTDLNGDGRGDFFIDSRGGGRSQKADSMPIALIHQSDGTFAVVRQGDTGWQFGDYLQFAWWPGGSGFIDTRVTGLATKFNSQVGGSMFNLTFTSNTPHWVGGTSRADTLSGTSAADELAGFAGNDSINGSAGIDVARYQGTRASAKLTHTGNQWTVTSAIDGTDTLINVERLQFTDTRVALDLNGNAGSVAKLIGAVFGTPLLERADLVGIGLSLLDKGMSYASLVNAAVQTPLFEQLAGGRSNTQFVEFLYSNVIGHAPDAATRAVFVGMLDRGEHTQSSLALLAAETPQNALHIDLVGLADTGIAYL